MNSIVHAERHKIALSLEAEIIGEPCRASPSRPQPANLRAERAIGRFLRYELDEQGLREALEAAKKAGAGA